MDWSIPLLVFSGFIGGMLAISRVLSWLVGLVVMFGSGAAGNGPTPALRFVQIVLHSGPWFLALTVGGIYYVASLSRPGWLWALLSGLGLAVAVLSAAVAFAYLRERQKKLATVPLASESLGKIRRRFFCITTFCFGGTLAASLLYQVWQQVGSSIALVVLLLGLCAGGGYLFSWFMWHWYGATLEANEQARQRQVRKNAV